MRFRANGEWENTCICPSDTGGKFSNRYHLGWLMFIMSQVLSSRVVTRLRALIVLPTRDLVMQVRETLEAVGKGRGLKVLYILAFHDHYPTDYVF